MVYTFLARYVALDFQILRNYRSKSLATRNTKF